MAKYTANNVVKTLTVHKEDCKVIPKDGLNICGCGDRGKEGNQRWFYERHISTYDVDAFMNGKFWAILFCNICF